jgi:uncharacterized protein YdaT
MTLLQFASSRYVEDNPMVRLLTNKEYPEKLSDLDLEIAKKIIEIYNKVTKNKEHKSVLNYIKNWKKA